MSAASSPSLTARALRWLAQREHSRSELRRKLEASLRADARAAAGAPAGAPAEPQEDTDTLAGAAAQRIEAALDSLEARGLLSAERFIESRIHARAAGFGTLRIRDELRRHDLALPADAAAELRATELQRATAIHARRFAATPITDPRERARRARFLTARGFAPETVRAVLQRAGRGPDIDADPADDGAETGDAGPGPRRHSTPG